MKFSNVASGYTHIFKVEKVAWVGQQLHHVIADMPSLIDLYFLTSLK